MSNYTSSRSAAPWGRPGGPGGSGGRGNDRDSGRHDELPTIALDGIRFGVAPAATLFSEVAERAAREISEGDANVNKASQLRRFYDELVMWQEKVGRDDQRFTECEPYIRMLKAKAAYARGRQHVDANFRAMFDRLIDEAKDAATLRQAKLFFEAFMAFYKVFRKQ
jgi:CRISPR-associated protein Csm2